MQQSLPLSRRQREAAPITPGPSRRHDLRWLGLPTALAALLVFWQTLTVVGNYRPFILPGPALVWQRFGEALASGVLWQHTAATLSVALSGFVIALIFGLALGYILAHIPWLERSLSPVLAASQAVPVIAVAPLIILWFGPGMLGKVGIAALITFLPIVLTTITALRAIPRELREMALISGANRWQILRYVEAQLALPVIFSGVRTGLALATTGAVVGEFIAGRMGLGAMINIARGLFDTPLIFVALATLATITLTLYLLSTILERMLVTWETP
jgi:NitT/TauT family transport system permease protein